MTKKIRPTDELADRIWDTIQQWQHETKATTDEEVKATVSPIMALAGMLGVHIWIAKQRVDEGFSNGFWLGAMKHIYDTIDTLENDLDGDPEEGQHRYLAMLRDMKTEGEASCPRWQRATVPITSYCTRTLRESAS